MTTNPTLGHAAFQPYQDKRKPLPEELAYVTPGDAPFVAATERTAADNIQSRSPVHGKPDCASRMAVW